MFPLLSIKNLCITFTAEAGNPPAADIDSCTMLRGETMALVGESGSGKSVTALSILRLLPAEASVSGRILFSDDGEKQVDLTAISLQEINKLRGNKIGMIFQEPMTSLNPVLTCGSQVIETLLAHKDISKREARQQALDLFTQVELPDPAAMLNRYPHEISGGQKQRVMIAIAICCNPSLLIADEPTTALDVRVQRSILDLIKKIQVQHNLAVLLITHDLAVVADVSDHIAVMYKGKIVEQGKTSVVLQSPQHEYTRALLACRPNRHSKGKRLSVLRDFMPPDSTPIEVARAVAMAHSLTVSPVLSVEQLLVSYRRPKTLFGKTSAIMNAVDNITFQVNKNEIVGIVGESGCGKTTLARAIMQLIKPTAGKICINDRDINALAPAQLRQERKNFQIVFQDPFGSLNPRLTIGAAILEALNVHNLHTNKAQRRDRIISLLEQVQLNASYYHRYPHQFSGGQRQRICIARALALEPSFLVFDESVSALDVSVQAQILNLITEIKAGFDFSAIFISHDLAVVHYISDRILVMNKGKIIESGTSDQVYLQPKEDYTRKLIAAIPGRGI